MITARKVALEDSLRRLAEEPGTLAAAFNNFSIENVLLRKDGGFLIDAGSYNMLEPLGIDTWNKFFRLTKKSTTGYIRYDPGHFPWTTYFMKPLSPDFVSVSTGNTIVFSCDSLGMPEWIRFLKMPEFSESPFTLGYGAFVVNDEVYYIYNHTERKATFPSLQIIDIAGNVREVMLKDADRAVGDKIVIQPRSFYRLGTRQGMIWFTKNGLSNFAIISL